LTTSVELRPKYAFGIRVCRKAVLTGKRAASVAAHSVATVPATLAAWGSGPPGTSGEAPRPPRAKRSPPIPDRLRPGRLVLLAPAAVVAVDALLTRASPTRMTTALLDEAAHLVTTLLFLGAVGAPPSTPVLGGAVAGAVLLDLDHLPRELGWDGLTRRSRRPYAHSLAGVAS